MKTIKTVGGHEFDVDWAAPVPITENIVMLIKIHGSDIDTVHNVFKDPEETSVLVKTIETGDNQTEVETYTGYTRYFGFSIETDGDIIVTLKKNLEV